MEIVLVAVLGSLTISHSIFWSIHLLIGINKSDPSNRLLALLLLALSLRIGKSIAILVFPEAEELLPLIGVTGLACIGPCLWLYTKASFSSNHPIFKSPLEIAHFGLALIFLLAIPFADDDLIYSFYQIGTAQMLAYLVGSILYFRKRDSTDIAAEKYTWMKHVLLGVSLITATFLWQLFTDTYASYVIATTMASMVLFVLSFWGVRHPKIFQSNTRNFRDTREIDHLVARITNLFDEHFIYREPNLSINSIAKSINAQPYVVSQAINHGLHRSLPELINEYRIREVQEKLTSPKHEHLSIESIAFDSGFNTLSAFYNSFRKQTNTTPAEYRKRFLHRVIQS